MSRLCRLKTASHGDDGKWAYDEIVSLRKQRDELLAAMNKLSGMKLNMVADGIVDKAIARAKKNLCGDSTNMVETSVPAIVFYPAGSLGEEVQP